MARFANAVTSFMTSPEQQFQLGHVKTGLNLKFDGCSKSRNSEGNLRLSLTDGLQRAKPVRVLTARRSNITKHEIGAETHAFHSLAGTLFFMIHTALPKSSYTASSKMQQRLRSLYITDIVEANSMIFEHQTLILTILFPAVNGIENATIVSFSDASHAGFKHGYSEIGVLTRLRLVGSKQTVFYPKLWTLHKQQKVCYVSYGAEI